jgi:hypothetical protein
MENFDIDKIPPAENLDEPISINDDNTSGASVSHSPLDLGSGGNSSSVAGAGQKIEIPAQPAGADAKKPGEKVTSAERITGVKTFFTKLHPGAMSFLDEQITKWLKGNPSITIKRTNIITGEVQAKKTEPNIIITVWY